MVIGLQTTNGLKEVRRLNRALKVQVPPIGTYMMIDTGDCPAGWSEDTAFIDRYPMGANASLGTTGGTESYNHGHSQGDGGHDHYDDNQHPYGTRYGTSSTASITWFPPYFKVKFCVKT